MEKFSGLIISCGRTLERNASSEIYYILTELLDYVDVNVEPVKDISGLSIAVFTIDPIVTIERIKEIAEKDISAMRYVLKLVPIQYRILTSLENYEIVSKHFSLKIDEGDTWKINLRRRHTTISREEIIKKIASKINKGKVMLDNPKKYLIVEVLGKWTYFSLSTFPELSMSKYGLDDIEDEFTF
ncbi:MAG: THUMP domain-containing protein [Candidatus Heimdallarchaeota archaeon]